MKQIYIRRLKILSLAVALALILSISSLVCEAIQPANPEQTATPPSRAEVDQLANRFLRSIQDKGNIRSVDKSLIHPFLLTNPPCVLVPFVDGGVCSSLSAEDRSDYTLATINILWQIYEYQLSHSELIYLKGDFKKNRPLDMIPPEALPFMSKLSGRAKTVEAFREMYAATKKVEALMPERHSRLSKSEKRNIQKNSKLMAMSLFMFLSPPCEYRRSRVVFPSP